MIPLIIFYHKKGVMIGHLDKILFLSYPEYHSENIVFINVLLMITLCPFGHNSINFHIPTFPHFHNII